MEGKLKPYGRGKIVRFKIMKHNDFKESGVTNKPNVGLWKT